ncbi:methionine adenosyltransferase [Methylocystis sp.]|uniref:methionine adenosyltransferase n=1 Tax=Methylocystis sp. TaxID=1911079 RepID=UPI0025D0112F|nr:methionine adenosyltransferase [Methylocystis sp.]
MTPERLFIRDIDHPSGDLLDFEIVERKGLGHPDTICDEIAEQMSLALSRLYLLECGEVLHHNVDKALCRPIGKRCILYEARVIMVA